MCVRSLPVNGAHAGAFRHGRGDGGKGRFASAATTIWHDGGLDATRDIDLPFQNLCQNIALRVEVAGVGGVHLRS